MASARQFLKEEKRSAKAFLAPEETDFSVGEMVSNIPSSAKKFVGDVVQPFLHPIDTAAGLYNLGMGAADKGARLFNELIPRDMPLPPTVPMAPMLRIGSQIREQMGYPKEAYADAMQEYMKQRYGSAENFKQTVMEDPVGVLADASMTLTGGGTFLSSLGGKAGQVGQLMQRAGMASEPINLGKNVVKTAIAKAAPKSWPLGLYESSAKFSTTLPKAKREAMAATALKNKILPTAKGIDKINDMINDLDTRINTLVDEATQSGKLIPKKALFKHLKEARKKVGGVKLEGDQNLKQIAKVAKKMDLQLRRLKKDALTPNEVQELKRSIYKQVNYDARNLRSQVGTDVGRKAIARAAKETVEEAAPVKELNRELGKLLELKEPLTRSAGRIENRNIVSIDAPIKIGAGGAAGGPGGVAAGTLTALFEHPKIKARIAVKLKELQDMGALGLVDAELIPTLMHYGLLESGRATTEKRKEKRPSTQ